MTRQMEVLETHYNRRELSIDEGDKLLQELREIHEMLDKYSEILATLFERARTISPMWQRGERITGLYSTSRG